MIKDKFIKIWNAENTETVTGGSTQNLLQFWKGWSKVTQKAFSTTMQTGQWVGNKSVDFIITKNTVTAQINENMQVEFRSKYYLIESIHEIDQFHLAIVGKEQKTVTEV